MGYLRSQLYEEHPLYLTSFLRKYGCPFHIQMDRKFESYGRNVGQTGHSKSSLEFETTWQHNVSCWLNNLLLSKFSLHNKGIWVEFPQKPGFEIAGYFLIKLKVSEVAALNFCYNRKCCFFGLDLTILKLTQLSSWNKFIFFEEFLEFWIIGNLLTFITDELHWDTTTIVFAKLHATVRKCFFFSLYISDCSCCESNSCSKLTSSLPCSPSLSSISWIIFPNFSFFSYLLMLRCMLCLQFCGSLLRQLLVNFGRRGDVLLPYLWLHSLQASIVLSYLCFIVDIGETMTRMSRRRSKSGSNEASAVEVEVEVEAGVREGITPVLVELAEASGRTGVEVEWGRMEVEVGLENRLYWMRAIQLVVLQVEW